MRYYRRYSADGSCVVICTRCFATIGHATGFAAAAALEGQHACGTPRPVEFADAALRSYVAFHGTTAGPVSRLAGFLRRVDRRYAVLVFAAIALVLYMLPNLVELAAIGRVSPWVTSILFGDLMGCACLALVLRMPRTGVVLYLALALCEGWLYATGRLSPGTLAWVTDAVPTLVVAGRVAQLWFRTGWGSQGQTA